MIKEFTSIHNHSHFSVMDGISLPDEMIRAAKERGLRSIAITDHGHCHAHADFYLHGKKQGVRTIFGVEAYVIDDLEAWKKLKEAKEEEDEDATNIGAFKRAGRKGHLILLACNREGLANLYELVYLAHKEGFYGKPRMDLPMLEAHSRGLVASSACMGGVISNELWALSRNERTWEEVREKALRFDRIFGRGRLFLELQLNESKSQEYINGLLIRLHEETGIPLTFTVDSHYVGQDDWKAQEVLYMLRDNKTMATRGPDWDFEVRQLYIKSPEEMWRSYESFGRSHIPEKVALEAFANTLLIDSLVEQYEPDVHQRLPTLREIENPYKRMGELAIAELKRRGLHEDPKYAEQLLHELKVIKEKGLANYFLIVREMAMEAKRHMLVGAGRGSAAGSLVCYMLGITDLDPIKHGLMFERFLDPSRTELPDIDMDYEEPKLVKQLLVRKFGEDNVASLSTYGTFQIKGLMKDVARVFDLDHNEVNKVNAQIERDLRVLYVGEDKSTLVIKLEDVERVSPAYNDYMRKHPELVPFVKKLYGRNRQVGRHAAGVIIGDALPRETSLFKQRDKESGEFITQVSFTEGIVNKNLSAMGFVKFDILGLACLRVIHHALDLIAERTGKTFEELRERIRPHNMDLDDIKVMKRIFWDGNFAGIFTFTEKGIRGVARSVKPDCFEDIVAISALYRPGPLRAGVDKLYGESKRKSQAGELKFEHPILERILKRTYGCLIYQEQLMEIARDLGKMEFKDVQRIRKVLLKKDKSKTEEFIKKENDELEAKFTKGCLENGLTKERAAQWWQDMKYFGGYGFNVAHSAAYSVATMQTAWLATYYPLEFYTALLTRGQAGAMQDYISDIKRAGVKILPVDINRSGRANRIEEGAIRLSLNMVKGVGDAAIDKILAGQPYADWFDFLQRSGVSKTAIQPLILVGAFQGLEPNLKRLGLMYDLMLDHPKYKNKRPSRGDGLCWDRYLEDAAKIQSDDYPVHEKVALENALMGFSVTGSPFEILDRRQKIEQLFDGVITSYQEFMESDLEVGMLPVVVKDFKERPQSNKQMFAFIKFGVESGEEFEAPAFSSLWKHLATKIRRGSVYVATFNRKPDDMERLIVGKPGFAQSEHSAAQAMINIDELT